MGKKYDLYKFKEQPCYVIADIHGVFDRIIPFIKEFDYSNCLIVVAGDCGFGFKLFKDYKDEFNLINKFLRKKNITMLMIRGNHDDPRYFNEEKIKLSNFKLIKDYSVISMYYEGDDEMLGLPKFSMLCVGGATSIDRTYRINRYNKRILMALEQYPWINLEKIDEHLTKGYWEDEAPIYDEEILDEIKSDGLMIEKVVTHTCPKFCFPVDKSNITYWLGIDSTLEEVLDNERNVMSLIYDKLLSDGHILNSWTYGHFHFHNEEHINGIKFTALTNFDSVFDKEEF